MDRVHLSSSTCGPVLRDSPSPTIRFACDPSKVPLLPNQSMHMCVAANWLRTAHYLNGEHWFRLARSRLVGLSSVVYCRLSGSVLRPQPLPNPTSQGRGGAPLATTAVSALPPCARRVTPPTPRQPSSHLPSCHPIASPPAQRARAAPQHAQPLQPTFPRRARCVRPPCQPVSS